MAANSPHSSDGKSNKHQYTGKLWRCGDPPAYVHTMSKNEGNPIDQMYKRIKKYDHDTCSRWQGEIENLLLFAGLFSATITAFIVDSYKWLQADNSAATAQLLAQISLQLSAIANNSAPIPPATLESSFTPDPRRVRINILWFLSLIMCLSTVIFGIMCLQCIREFSREMSFSSTDAITIRQMRYDGLWYWKVPDVIAWLPIILQMSVLLFFAGILDLLWSVQHLLAGVLTAAVGLVVFAALFTTIAPVIQTIRVFHHFNKGSDPDAYVTPCPYRSPISWVILRLIMLVDPVLFWQQRIWTSWGDFDIFFHEKSKQEIRGTPTHNAKGLARALAWAMNELSPELNQDILRDIYHSISFVDSCTSGTVLVDWAGMTGEAKNVASTFEDARRSGMHQAQYDLLLERLLRKCSPVEDNRKLPLELQVRCLNDNEEMAEFYTEAANTCNYFCKEAQDQIYLKNDALLFQVLMALLKFYNRLCRQAFTGSHVGSVLAHVIRHTVVTEDNANLCYAILDQFKQTTDEIFLPGSDSFRTPPSLVQQHHHRMWIQLDLHAMQKWETDIRKLTGNDISVADGLLSFMENFVPILEGRGLAHDAGEIKSQLGACRDSKTYTYVYPF